MSFFTGTPGKFEQKSLLGPEQQPLYQQLLASAQGQGAGGAFGSAADYYRGLLNDNNSTFNAMAAPEQRNFNENTIPSLSAQFAGMGSGGLSSSSFRNAAVGAGTDLSERLGAIRAQLRQQGAQGLMGLGQQGLQQYNENIYFPGQGGLADSIGPGLGAALTGLIPGAGGAIGGLLSGALSNWFSNKGTTSPYGGNSQGGKSASRIGR